MNDGSIEVNDNEQDHGTSCETGKHPEYGLFHDHRL